MRAAVRSAGTALECADRIGRQWRSLNFTAPPDFALAVEQSAAFTALLRRMGTSVDEMPGDEELTLDAMYVRDAAVATPLGVVLCRMGKATRRAEPVVHGRGLAGLGVPVLGVIEPPGLLEGGDVVFFDDGAVAVGQGYRTNGEGITQLRAFLGGTDLMTVPLPHYRGPSDVFHLMSIVSPVDRDLAVVYSPLMPVPFRQWLESRGIRLVEVPDEEFESMGANVLAVAPRRCVMLEGNPVTRARLEAAGAEVHTYEGSEISVKGGGGPTCLTLPLVRAVP
ncbi:MAG: dimethylarginine dimethylaminohydrolase family protein [Acidobacteriota bacterium]